MSTGVFGKDYILSMLAGIIKELKEENFKWVGKWYNGWYVHVCNPSINGSCQPLSGCFDNSTYPASTTDWFVKDRATL